MSRGKKETRLPSLRDAHADTTRGRILEAAWALALEGEEPSMRAVSVRAGVAERTIYRHFESLEVLAEALAPQFSVRAGVPLCARADQLEPYAAELFATFEANRALVTMMLTTPWWLKFARRSRSKNLAALRALLDEAYPRAPEADRSASAATLRAVLSGSGWLYLRESCGLPIDEIIRSAQWMIRLHLAALAAKRS